MFKLSSVGTVPLSALPMLLSLVLVTAACSPQSMETAPVHVETAKGTVVCQLYTTEVVYWDRSIARPDKMTTQEADAICIERGRKAKNG